MLNFIDIVHNIIAIVPEFTLYYINCLITIIVAVTINNITKFAKGYSTPPAALNVIAATLKFIIAISIIIAIINNIKHFGFTMWLKVKHPKGNLSPFINNTIVIKLNMMN